jgi:ABC-type transport system substrate-binding protein
VNIIHSSSLAYSPVAYSKLQSGRVDNAESLAIDAGNGNPETRHSEFNTRPSNIEQIKAALSEAGLPNDNGYSLPNNTRTQKALNAYSQNHNQAAQLRAAQIISGIDLYA